MKRRLILLAVATLLLGACDRSQNTSGVSDEEFVETVVALRQAANEAGGDVAAYTAARQQVLSTHGVTEEQLQAYVQAHADETRHMARIWERINEELLRAVNEK